MAVSLSGIGKNFQGTGGMPGRIERDANGEPTGILRSCRRLVKIQPREKTPTADDRRQRLKMLLADYNSVGLTSISERDLGDAGIELYRRLRENGELTCRVYVMYSVDAQLPFDKIEERMLSAARSPLHRYNNMLWVRGVKTYMDGGMLTGSAYMLQPWGISKVYSITDPNYRGMRYIEPGKLYQIARLALKNQLQFTAHAVGDGAVQGMIDAYSEVNNDFPVRSARPCITHANFMNAEAIRKMKDLGIVLDLQPVWLWLDGATLRKQFGNGRLNYFQPFKSLFDNGVIEGGGSDHMQKIGSLRSINPYNPFLGMWITLTRQPRWTDESLHPEQRISREQAIRLYTINNAYLTFEEKQKGSLENGKLPARYFQLIEAGAAQVEKRLDAEPAADLQALEARDEWRHFPYSILAPAVLYAKRHPDNARFHDPRMLALAIRIGDLLASENQKGRFEPRLDSDWDTYMWLEAYRLLEPELGEERRARWKRAIEANVALVVSDAAERVDFPWYNSPYIGTSPNHYAQYASLLFLAGRVTGNKDWVDLGARILHRFAAVEQAPDGYWGEHSRAGPTTG